MSSEKRLLEPGQSQGLARELLRAGSEIPLSTERKDRLWRSIALALPPGGGSPPPDPAPPAAPPTTGALAGSQAGALSLGAKAAVSLGVGLLWVGAWFAGSALPGMLSPPSPAVVTRPPGQDAPGAHAAAQAAQAHPEAPDTTPPAPTAAPAARATAATAATAASDPGSPGGRGATSAGGAVGGASNHGSSIQETTTPPALPGAEDPAGTGSLPAAPAPSASAEAPASAAEIARQERINQLHEEAEMTRAARSALRGGDAAGALRLLEQLRLKFGGRGQLHQEREALAIEALGRSGQREQARARAEAFLRAYPTSPHAPDVQVFARLSRVVAVSARPVIFF